MENFGYNGTISISVEMCGCLSYAAAQNSVPLIRSIVVRNLGDEPLTGLTARVIFEPAFAREFAAEIQCVPAKSLVELSPVRVILSPEYLLTLTEGSPAAVRVEIVKDGAVLCGADKEIRLLAYDQWQGVLFMPELLAAFVTPNHPRVTEVTIKAGKYLQKWTGSPSFSAYQTCNPNIAKLQAAAIYAALQEENIAYITAPASFEDMGQRIRLPEAVLNNKQGTCLDLSLLYASCLEAVGLNAIVVIVKGHAFGGCRLSDETFPEVIEDDVAALTKRIAAGVDELTLTECTAFTAGGKADFDRAAELAAAHLGEPADFIYALDIKRSRGSGIRPMPSRIVADGKITCADYGARKKSEITSAPKEIDMALHTADAVGGTITKQAIWERKLLDLSLRNALLNFRPSSSNIQLIAPNLGVLEDAISGGADFRVLPVPKELSFTGAESKCFEAENDKDMLTAIAETEFAAKRLRTFITEEILEKTLKKLHRSAKVSLEENGANTLYLALGFLRWFETDKSEKPRYAPLVLVPVDIVRKLQERSYAIRVRDEETQMNITLLELLRQDFGISINGLNPIPTDESGINLPLVFSTMRQGVMTKKRWDIVEAAFIGQFSFSQFIMWNDIRSRSDELAKNKVVASLISGKRSWQPQSVEITPSELDAKVLPSDMALPLSADSSQLAAAYEASSGESFVLHGPPGTGKSQTITNMIANALFQGKSVLFVAEKMAALSVVQKRLEKIGLAPFCLELHSNKAQKRAVLAQLEATLSVGHYKPAEGFEAEAAGLHALRTELNGVMSELHRERFFGCSVYDAIVTYEKNAEYADLIEFGSSVTSRMNPSSFAEWCETIKAAVTAGRECGGYENSALRSINCTRYSLELRDGLEKAAEELSALCGKMSAELSALSGILGTELMEKPAMLSDAAAIISEASSSPIIVTSALTDPSFSAILPSVTAAIEDGKRYNIEKAALLQTFDEKVLGFDADTAWLEWKKNAGKWFLAKSLGEGKFVKELNLYTKSGAAVTKENIVGFYEKLSGIISLGKKLSVSPAAAVLGALWQGVDSDFALLSSALEHSLRLRTLISGFDCDDKSAVVQAVLRLSVNAAEGASAAPALTSLSRYNSLVSLLTVTYAADKAIFAGDFSSIRNEADGWREGASGLKDWTVLVSALSELSRKGLGTVAKAYKSGRITEENILQAFLFALSKAEISAAMKESPVLSAFQGAKFEDKIKKYRETTDEFSELTIRELAARLSAKIPENGAGAAASSEIGILWKAIKSGGRMTPIRKLFDSIPNLLRKICPCMLMSPISVAQYIDPTFPKFDLVIFDEASQLPTSEAVGAIARGENVVVVGDPKQLPPTSFFSANQFDEENYEKEDLESVLDDCLSLSMPQRHLLWHYRSRHESLIAYSNAKYYDNSLLTFPSPDDLSSRVSWIKVEGVYDKGGTKQNKAEGEAIVAEIERRLRDPELSKRSIGVVTFSVVQQNLIDDMLSERFSADFELEKAANAMHEPLFVKNLENVQGDERDVILFSVGYGPDKDGKVSMNFGPLNRDGGWRRLNVAISRARMEMRVYSVITPEMINLSRTRADGVAGLKGFLEFAANGKDALSVNSANFTEKRNAFASLIAERLLAEGFDLRTGIGCSGYKIDIGIIDREHPDTYSLGIMCDGETGDLTARDRNIVQPSVLSGLGWSIISVHILDWLDNPDKVTEKIKNACRRAKSGKKAEEPIVREPVKLETMAAPEPEPDEVYIAYKPQQLGTPELYYDERSRGKILRMVKEALALEAPVSRKTLMKYNLAAWGLSRSGARVEKQFDDSVMPLGLTTTEYDGAVFYWGIGQQPQSYTGCRLHTGESRRAFEDITAEEIRNGMIKLLRRQVSMLKPDLLRETAKLFGYARSSEAIERSVNMALVGGVRLGLMKIDTDTGRIILCGEQ